MAPFCYSLSFPVCFSFLISSFMFFCLNHCHCLPLIYQGMVSFLFPNTFWQLSHFCVIPCSFWLFVHPFCLYSFLITLFVSYHLSPLLCFSFSLSTSDLFSLFIPFIKLYIFYSLVFPVFLVVYFCHLVSFFLWCFPLLVYPLFSFSLFGMCLVMINYCNFFYFVFFSSYFFHNF